MSRSGSRIAIVGNGPRALWALERLDARLADAGATAPSSVHVFGAGELGAGRVYAPDQPDHLRLNVTASVVDLWCGDAARGPSFDSWREVRRPGSSTDAYPSRALTGRYLSQQADRVVTSLERSGCRVVRRADHVGRLSRDPSGWLVGGQGPFDEVLLAVGHAQDWGGALRHRTGSMGAPLQASTFPVTDLVARPELRPGATVVVRGAALTAIDAVLALTLGRGHRPAESDLDIVLASRTGRLMMPKSERPVVADLLARVGDLADVRAAVSGGTEVPIALRDTAVRVLGAGSTTARIVDDAMAALVEGGPAPSDATAWLRHGVDMARGQEPPDGAWALGQAWRLLYPDLVRRQRATASGPPLGWRGYAAASRELERLAFGPPLVNADLLLEGLEAGTVRVQPVAAGDRIAAADLVVDAVLPPPGIVDLPADDLLGRLRDDGVLSRDPARRGARVGADATVIDASGQRVDGLALVGRATEDEVLGTDTLVRELHTDIDGWARRVVALSMLTSA